MHGRLVTMTELPLNHPLCLVKERNGKKSEFLHFNEWEPNRSEKEMLGRAC